MTHQETFSKQRISCDSHHLSNIHRFTESPTVSSDTEALDSNASVHGGDIDTCLYGSVVGMDQMLMLERNSSAEGDSSRPLCRGLTSSLSPCALYTIRRYSYGSNQTTTESSKSEGSCEECDREEAKQNCEECGMRFCLECDAHWHRKGKLRYHTRTMLNSEFVTPMTLCEPFDENKEPIKWAVDDILAWLRSHELDIFSEDVEKYKIDGAFLLSTKMDIFLSITSQNTRGEKRKFAREIQKLKRIALCNLRRINMNKLSGVISLAAIVASAYAQVTVMDAGGSPQMKIEQSTPGHSEDTKNVLTDATALVNKNNAVVDNNIGVSDSNVLLTQNDRFHVKKQSGTIHVHGAKKNEEDEDQDQEYFWRGGYGYPSYGYNYRYRNWW
uniref:Mitogenactivated protein kinase kinase putative n=1 Tax=Albugo laibachii Nc14 TaxID=890382 RepID=F0WJV5_9STRA|nr:mitogenactivated protein kinase kinase putative [Albugo laibachii Nc14]|eukprot:CCA21557.1 mitogenactivated protein kinase kinase putative [Albugo laibachii Nc14]